MFFKKFKKRRVRRSNLQDAFDYMVAANTLIFSHKWDTRTMPSAEDLKLLDTLENIAGNHYRILRYVNMCLHQRAQGKPESEDCPQWHDKEVFDRYPS